jgi:hypothetical protein
LGSKLKTKVLEHICIIYKEKEMQYEDVGVRNEKKKQEKVINGGNGYACNNKGKTYSQ